jgi:hypothetical protein
MTFTNKKIFSIKFTCNLLPSAANQTHCHPHTTQYAHNVYEITNNPPNIYVQFKVQLDVVLYVFFILCSTCFGCYLHPSSGAQLQLTAICVCMVLVCYSIVAGTGRDTLTPLARSISDSETERAKSVSKE